MRRFVDFVRSLEPKVGYAIIKATNNFIMNEFFAHDFRRKTLAIIKVRAQDGKRVSHSVPHGCRRGPPPVPSYTTRRTTDHSKGFHAPCLKHIMVTTSSLSES